MDDQTRSIIRNVKGPGMHKKISTRSTVAELWSNEGQGHSGRGRTRSKVLTKELYSS